MHLIIDNSNTRTKFALDDGSALTAWRAIVPTAELSKDTLRHTLQNLPFSKATICSVVPEAADLLANNLPCPTHHVTWQSPLTITIDYPQPAQIGADRLANSEAAFTTFAGPAVVIDFGTAVTFDVISAAGAYLGGVIAPGTAALRDYLHNRTALLPKIQLEEPASAIGRSTEDAMQIGAVVGYRGLIREILNEITAELSETPTVIATGGDAALIAAGLARIQKIDPDLTLQGIRQIGRAYHFPK